jgi:hypothetical protein
MRFIIINNVNNLNVTNVSKSQGVITGSNNLMKIEGGIYSFNELYEMINENDDKADEIKENLKLIEKELKKEEINPSKIKTSVDLLRRNAYWTIPTIASIMMPLMGLG